MVLGIGKERGREKRASQTRPVDRSLVESFRAPIYCAGVHTPTFYYYGTPCLCADRLPLSLTGTAQYHSSSRTPTCICSLHARGSVPGTAVKSLAAHLHSAQLSFWSLSKSQQSQSHPVRVLFLSLLHLRQPSALRARPVTSSDPFSNPVLPLITSTSSLALPCLASSRVAPFLPCGRKHLCTRSLLTATTPNPTLQVAYGDGRWTSMSACCRHPSNPGAMVILAAVHHAVPSQQAWQHDQRV